MACIVIVSGEQQGTYFQLAKRPLSGGRDPARDIQIIDPKVSRRHFLISPQSEGYVIRELQARNGVYVDGERITEDRTLCDGDQIRVGATLLEFHEADNPDRTNGLQKFKKADRRLREDQTFND